MRLSRGVFINHTGPLTWRQRAWAAVLSVPGAALSHESALRAGGLDSMSGQPIHLAVGRKSAAPRRAGVVVHRYSGLAERVMGTARPPRVRIEHAVLDVAATAPGELETIAVLADSVRARVTTVDRLRRVLAERKWYSRRALVNGVLDDVEAGTCSVLEHRYLTRVERAHGLPTPRRQAPTRVGRRGFRDIDYDEWCLVVELDGRLFHDEVRARDRDLERDLDAAVGSDRRTLRLGWGQVYDRPCSTARKVGLMLTRLGWTGVPSRCPDCELPSGRTT
ncbi:hypothetical protein GOARA_048_00320 [Gordonia araii NBRC 100433]|uniref:DUF559 domain-containing protein n=1 Tax=Gordonia araii NBRC 100433 TaxID=1073574 RepID=G7H1V5_9ACTN|nr:hypothetical protein GOARA_048_00320 [Gordonia araii NBRC 100433]